MRPPGCQLLSRDWSRSDHVVLQGSDWFPHVVVEVVRVSWFTTWDWDCSLVKLVVDHSQITPALGPTVGLQGGWWEHQSPLLPPRTQQTNQVTGAPDELRAQAKMGKIISDPTVTLYCTYIIIISISSTLSISLTDQKRPPNRLEGGLVIFISIKNVVIPDWRYERGWWCTRYEIRTDPGH